MYTISLNIILCLSKIQLALRLFRNCDLIKNYLFASPLRTSSGPAVKSFFTIYVQASFCTSHTNLMSTSCDAGYTYVPGNIIVENVWYPKMSTSTVTSPCSQSSLPLASQFPFSGAVMTVLHSNAKMLLSFHWCQWRIDKHKILDGFCQDILHLGVACVRTEWKQRHWKLDSVHL